MIVVNVATSSESSVACSDPDCTVTAEPDLGLDPADELVGRDAGLGRDLHRVELALLVEQRLGGRDVEDGERRAAERAQLAVLRDADDLVLAGGAERGDADPVAGAELLLVRDRLVDRDLLTAAPASGPRRG